MWETFWEWAWARHHNVLSWYIRPLFLLPYVWFAYRRSVLGMALTVVALLTSMFWFPAPPEVDPQVQAFLAAERAYVTGAWTLAKIGWTLTIPVFFVLLAVAFWRRSWRWGLTVMAVAALGKIAWSLAEGGDSGTAILAPALTGLGVCVVAVVAAVTMSRRRR